MHNTAQFFDQIFQHSKVNAILVMSPDGIISAANEAFTRAYGYTTEDLRSKHFRILFVEKDQVTRKPEIELNITHREGASSDENYLVHKDGTPIWVTGESVLVHTENESCIVKVIHNIHAQKQLERYLLHTNDLLDSLFESVQQSGLLLLNTRMKTIKANETFKRIFALEGAIAEDSKLQDLGHPFWSGEEIKTDIRNALVNGALINKEYVVEHAGKQFAKISVTSKLIVSEDTLSKNLLLMIKPL